MPDKPRPSDQDQQLERLRKLYEDGVLSEDLYRAALAGLAVDPATIFDQRGQVVGRQINIAGNYLDQRQIMPILATPVTLRRAYLNRLVQQTRRLPLTGVDPKVVGDSDSSELQLSAVYTALLTQSSEMEDESRQMRMSERKAHKTRRLSALEVMNRESRLVLLGDPGSGKSAFVSFVALCLAGEALDFEDANLKILTMPLPPDGLGHCRSDEPGPQRWIHGALLPIRIVLRDLAGRGLPPLGERISGDVLWNFIVAELGETLREFAPHLKRELMEQGGLIMLDGLDEVPDAGNRRDQVKQAVQSFASGFPRCRFLVTSRTYAYQRQDWKLAGFAEAVLSPFTLGQVMHFVDNWYAHIAAVRGLTPQFAQDQAALLKTAIQHSEHLAELATRPLLLTLMTSLHAWRGGSLPERREELYADVVDLLLDQWESPKVVRDAAGNIVVLQPSLSEWLKVDRGVVRSVLNQLAFESHSHQVQLMGTADVSQSRLVSALLDVTRNPDVRPVRLVEYISDRAGLLMARGVGVYAFPHRALQEYLAACHLVDVEYPSLLVTQLRDDDARWREVALLAVSKVGRATASAVWVFVDALCPYDWPPPSTPVRADWYAALRAAQALIETGEYLRTPERQIPVLNRVRQWLKAIVDSDLPETDRIEAEHTLMVLGGPRRGIKLDLDSDIQSFLDQAKFDILAADTWGLLCTSKQPFWADISPLYVGLIQNQTLDLDVFQSLCSAVEKALGDLRGRTIVLVIDRSPQVGDLHQIFALRAQRGLTIVPFPRSLIAQARLQKHEMETLRGQIDLYGGRKDLYDTSTAVTDVLSFFGRQTLLADLEQQLTSGRSMILFGLRKIGKSSLLGRLREESRWPVAMVDMEGYINTPGYAYEDALRSWQVALKLTYPNVSLPELGRMPATPNLPKQAQFFRRAAIRLLDVLAKQPNRPGILLFLDEMEVLSGQADYIEFAAFLRSIAEDTRCRGRFSILAAGLEPLINRLDYMNSQRNPFFRFFGERSVGPLDEADIHTMIVSIGGQMGISYSDDALAVLTKAGGGHPFLTRQLCSQTIHGLERPVTVYKEQAVHAIESYLREARNYLADSLWGIDNSGPPAEEAVLLKALATHQPQLEVNLLSPDLPPEQRRARHLALDHLRDQSLIRYVEGQGWELTIPLYRQWIRRYILNLPDEP